MGWGITFSVDESEESKLIHLPMPTAKYRRYVNWLKKEKLTYHYQIRTTPNNKEHWQMLASIKVQLASAFETIEFHDEHEDDIGDGKIYEVGELKKYFPNFVRFPKPYFDGTVMEILTRHAKRLHYEGKLHLEQLMFLSWWCVDLLPKREMQKPKELRSKKDMATGITQLMKRAVSAMKFAQENKDGWKVKLTKDELRQAHSRGAIITNRRRSLKSQLNAYKASILKNSGFKVVEIASKFGVKRETVSRWLNTNSLQACVGSYTISHPTADDYRPSHKCDTPYVKSECHTFTLKLDHNSLLWVLDSA